MCGHCNAEARKECTSEMDDVLEQLDACYDIAHLYKCVMCNERQGHEPVVIVQDLPEGGSRLTIVTSCIDCLPKVKEMSYNG